MMRCCFAGCLFKNNRHREYLRHLAVSHRSGPLECKFKKCPEVFSDFKILLSHVEEHWNLAGMNINKIMSMRLYLLPLSLISHLCALRYILG
jgi:hypothetical protein